jgi:uncharacterized membrane protein YfcA
MMTDDTLLLALAIFAVAILYSSVGHAGASGYIAVMSLFGLSADFIKPVALVLNVGVAAIGTWQFVRAGHFSWRLFWPFAVLAVPFAWLGGWLNLPGHVFKIIVGVVLLFSAWRFMFQPPADEALSEPSRPAALGLGAGLGFLSGLTGTGGGIFLTPLLLFMRWSPAKIAAGVSAAFILVNSIAALLGNQSSTHSFPALAWPLVAAALAGGLIGSTLGSRHLPHGVIKKCLAAVLFVAGLKLIFAH